MAEENASVVDFLAYCHGVGIPQVELLDVFWKNFDVEIDGVLRALRRFGITVTSYAVSNDLADPDPDARERSLRSILEGIEIAKCLETPIVRVFSGSLREGVRYDAALEWVVGGLETAAARARDSNVTLCLENHGLLAGRGSQTKDIIDRVDSLALRSTFDTGNFLLVDERPTVSLEALLPYVAHVHVKDFRPDPAGKYVSLGGARYEGAPAGDGAAELREVVSRLRDAGYQGAYVLEYEGPGSERDGVAASRGNWEKIWN